MRKQIVLVVLSAVFIAFSCDNNGNNVPPSGTSCTTPPATDFIVVGSASSNIVKYTDIPDTVLLPPKGTPNNGNEYYNLYNLSLISYGINLQLKFTTLGKHGIYEYYTNLLGADGELCLEDTSDYVRAFSSGDTINASLNWQSIAGQKLSYYSYFPGVPPDITKHNTSLNHQYFAYRIDCSSKKKYYSIEFSTDSVTSELVLHSYSYNL